MPKSSIVDARDGHTRRAAHTANRDAERDVVETRAPSTDRRKRSTNSFSLPSSSSSLFLDRTGLVVEVVDERGPTIVDENEDDNDDDDDDDDDDID